MWRYRERGIAKGAAEPARPLQCDGRSRGSSGYNGLRGRADVLTRFCYLCWLWDQKVATYPCARCAAPAFPGGRHTAVPQSR